MKSLFAGHGSKGDRDKRNEHVNKEHVNQTHLLMLTATLLHLTLHIELIFRLSLHRVPIIQTVSQSLIIQTVSLHHTLPTPITHTGCLPDSCYSSCLIGYSKSYQLGVSLQQLPPSLSPIGQNDSGALLSDSSAVNVI